MEILEVDERQSPLGLLKLLLLILFGVCGGRPHQVYLLTIEFYWVPDCIIPMEPSTIWDRNSIDITIEKLINLSQSAFL